MHMCRHGEQCPLLANAFKFLRNRVRVWDNGGETFDRYTVAIKYQRNNRILWDIYGMSKGVDGVQGFNQYSHTHEGNTFTMDAPNVRTRWNNIPYTVVKAIIERA